MEEDSSEGSVQDTPQPTTSFTCAFSQPEYPQRDKETANVPGRDVSLEGMGLARQPGPGTIRNLAWN